MTNLVEYLRSIYIEGQRYNLLLALSGTLVKMGVPLQEALNLYSQIRGLDDENRENLIIRTYDRYDRGYNIQTLYSFKDIPEFQKLYALVSKEFSKYKVVKYVSDDLDNLSIEELNNNNYINLEEISMEVNPNITPLAYKYLKSRKITDENIEKYNIRVGKGELKEYILFPIFENNKCVYYIGRNYVGRNPRYKNAKGKKSDYIWFSDNPKSSDTIIICEGIINAITIYNYTNILTCAVFGKIISTKQLIKLQRYNNIILNFDGDVDKSYIVNKILPHFSGKNVMLVEMPLDKDANDMTRDEYIQHFLNRQHIDEFSFIQL